MAEVGSSEGGERVELDVNRAAETEDSRVSCFQMEFGARNGGGIKRKRSWEMEMETERGGCSRMSDDDQDHNASAAAPKKLRLSKQQSAFLEESFKEHTTLNPVSLTPKHLLNNTALYNST